MTFDVYMAHYTAVADASPVPVIVYNVPVFHRHSAGVTTGHRARETSEHPRNERQFRRRSTDFRSCVEYRIQRSFRSLQARARPSSTR